MMSAFLIGKRKVLNCQNLLVILVQVEKILLKTLIFHHQKTVTRLTKLQMMDANQFMYTKFNN